MDLQSQKDVTCSSHEGAVSNFSSPEYWLSTSFQSPTNHEVLSISSLVPSTVLTFVPQYKSTTNRSPHPGDSSFFGETSEPQPLKASPSHPVSPEARHQKSVTSASPSSDNPQDAQQRIQTDGGPLENSSIGILLPKELHSGEPGMVIIKDVALMHTFDNAQQIQVSPCFTHN